VGLTIHYSIRCPARWQAKTIRAKLEQVRQFALDLPVATVSEIGEFTGNEANFQWVRENRDEEQDPFFWAKIQAGRSISSPWEPGRSRDQPPHRMICFRVWPGEGCEEANFGICTYKPTKWKANTLKEMRASGDRCGWCWVLDKGGKDCDRESYKIFKTFLKKYKLRKMPDAAENRWFSWEHSWMDYWPIGGARIAKGRYLSHRKGYGPSYGVVLISSSRRMTGPNYNWFRYQGTAEEAKAVFNSAEFKEDLKAILFGKTIDIPSEMGWHSFCKTQYANDPRTGGWDNFKRCHLCVIALLKKLQAVGFEVEVSDEGDFWGNEDLAALEKTIHEWDAFIGAGLGGLRDASAHPERLQTAMTGRPDAEHLEARGHTLLGEEGVALMQTQSAAIAAVAEALQPK